MLNKIIDLDFLEANIKEIESLKDKKLLNAILMLAKVQNNDLIINNKNIERIISVTPSTVFAFNQAIIKDISSSYDLFEESIIMVKKSEYNQLLVDDMILFDKPIFLSSSFNENLEEKIELIEKQKKEVVEKYMKNFVNEQGVFGYYDYKSAHTFRDIKDLDSTRRSWHNISAETLSHREMEYISKSGIFTSSNDIVITFVPNDEKDDYKKGQLVDIESKKILVLNALKFGAKTTRYNMYPTNPAKFTKADISPRLSFIEKCFEEMIGIDYKTFIELAKKTEMFTYGYLKNSSSYVSKKTSRWTYESRNTEYSVSVKDGREVLEKLNMDLETINAIVQYGINTKENAESLIAKLQENKGMLITNIAKEVIVDSLSFEFNGEKISGELDKLKFLEIKINALVNGLNNETIRGEFIDNTNGDLKKELQCVESYLKAKKSIDKSLEVFEKVKEKEYSILENESLTTDEVNQILRKFIFRTRANIYDVKVDSYVLDMRNDKFEMNELLAKEVESTPDLKNALENIKENRFYDYFEFDSDFINGKNGNGDKEESIKKLTEFTEAIKYLNMPVNHKGAFKVRKLGNYGNGGVRGLFTLGVNQITVDTRNGHYFASVKHEETHRIDLNNINKSGRYTLVNILTDYFDKRIDEKNSMRNYYLDDAELMARAGEISAMLFSGNFEKHKADYLNGLIKKEEVWEKVKKEFEDSKDRVLMKSYERYANSEEYIAFENALDNGTVEQELIDYCIEYYRPFYTNERTNLNKLTASRKVGNEDREIEGISPKAFTYINFDKNIEKELYASLRDKIKAVGFQKLDFTSYGEIEAIDAIKEFSNGNIKEEVLFEQLRVGQIDFINWEEKLTDEAVIKIANHPLFKEKDKVDIHSTILKAKFPNEIFKKTFKSLYEKNDADLIKSYLRGALGNKHHAFHYYIDTVKELTTKNKELNSIILSFVAQEDYYMGDWELKKLIDEWEVNNEAFVNVYKKLRENKQEYANENRNNYSILVFNKELIEKIIKRSQEGKVFTKEQLQILEINNYEDFKKQFLGKSKIQAEYLSFEKVLSDAQIEFDKAMLIHDVKKNGSFRVDTKTDSITINQSEIEKISSLFKEDINTALQNKERYADNEITKIICESILENGTKTDAIISFFKEFEDLDSKGKEIFFKSIKLETIIGAILKETSFVELNKFIKYIKESSFDEVTLKYKNCEFITKQSQEKVEPLKSNADKIALISDFEVEVNGFHTRLFERNRFYMALKTSHFEIANEIFAKNGATILPETIAIIQALSFEKNIDIFDCLKNSENFNHDQLEFQNLKKYYVEFTKKYQFDYTTNPKKILGVFFEDIKKNGDIRDRNFITTLAKFSKEIDENNLYSYSLTKTKKVKEFIEEELPIDYSINSIVKFEEYPIVLTNKELEELNGKINEVLNSLDCYSFDGRKGIAKEIKKNIEKYGVSLQEKSFLKMFDVELKSNCKLTSDNDKHFRMNAKEYLLKEVIKALNENNESNSVGFQSMVDMCNKLSYHRAIISQMESSENDNSKEVQEHQGFYEKGASVVDVLLKNEALKNLEINYTLENYQSLKQLFDVVNADKISTIENIENEVNISANAQISKVI